MNDNNPKIIPYPESPISKALRAVERFDKTTVSTSVMYNKKIVKNSRENPQNSSPDGLCTHIVQD